MRCRDLGATVQLGQAFGDNLCGVHHGLAQLRIFGDLALDMLALALQKIAQAVELVEESVDLLEGATCKPLKQRIDAARTDLAVALRLRLTSRRHIPADHLADLSF